MRRGVGLSGLQKQAAAKETYKDVGKQVAAANMEQLKSQFDLFKGNLEEFAKKHQKEISKNALLRGHFVRMCTAIGVDPLVSGKGFWADLLGVGDFYYELAVQVVESCLVMQERTGGLVSFDAIKSRIIRQRGRNAIPINDEDIFRAVKALKPLGSGYAIVDLTQGKAIQSMPLELSQDGLTLLSQGEATGYLDEQSTCLRLSWSSERFNAAIDCLIRDGVVWIDSPDGDRTLYWFPCFFFKDD